MDLTCLYELRDRLRPGPSPGCPGRRRLPSAAGLDALEPLEKAAPVFCQARPAHPESAGPGLSQPRRAPS